MRCRAQACLAAARSEATLGGRRGVSFCFFELLFFGKRVNPVSRQAFRGRDAGGERATHAFTWGNRSLEFQL